MAASSRNTTITPAATTTTTFIDDSGFTVGKLPPGWFAIDKNNASPEDRAFSNGIDSEYLVKFCPPEVK
jgi:hypothetical protein